MSSFLIADAQAQAAGAPPPGGGVGQIAILVIFVVVFYFLLIRPQQKRAKEHQAMLSKLSSGDEVVTAGGIVGRIREINENFVSLEIASDVCITVQRGQVTSLVPKGTYKSA
ncbi:MAG: hypothetical protein RLZZ200_847 [Pseudomonadota bacterium]|jgi:preprotein translocase subunit YajC